MNPPVTPADPRFPQLGDVDVRQVADLAGDQRGRVLGERPVQREDDFGAVRDRPLVGAVVPGPRRQPRVGELLGELAQPGPAERRLPVFGGRNEAMIRSDRKSPRAGFASCQQCRQSTG